MVEKTAGCWLWLGYRNATGYGRFWTGTKLSLAHRFAWEQANGVIPQDRRVLHRCDNPPCVNPAHLFLGTLKDNTADMIAKGRGGHLRGAEHPSAKLTLEQVKTIRHLCASGVSQSEAARLHGVNHRTVHLIVHNLIWKEEHGCR